MTQYEGRTVVTSQGSEYKYLPDGTTQRFKKTEGREYETQSVLVFIPDYQTLKKVAPPDFDVVAVFGENETQYAQRLLERTQTEGARNYVVNARGKKLETNQDVQKETGPIFLTFGSEAKVDFFVPVSREPKIGYSTFDTRKFYDEKEGVWKRERHLGNKVVEIK